MLCSGKLSKTEALGHLPHTAPRNSFDDVDRACIEIAGIRVAIECADSQMQLGASEAMQNFLVDKTEAHVNIRSFWGSPDVVPNGRKLFDSGSLWQLYTNGETNQFRFFSPSFGAQPYEVATFSSDFASGEIYLSPHGDSDPRIFPFEYPLNELLFINLLAQGRGVELHAAGLIDAQGDGRLFLGQSGAGKTTISRLWQSTERVQILSDDRIIVRNEEGRLWMYGTPWHGEGLMASQARAPLAQICFLRHGPRNKLVPLQKAEAVARMFACSFPPFFSAEGIAFTMEFLQTVADAVPCFELGFLPNKCVVNFLTHNHPLSNRADMGTAIS